MDDSCLDLVFPSIGGREVVGRFDGGDLTSDAGMLLLRQADKRLGLVNALTAAIEDRRQEGKTAHGLREMLAARVFAIAGGYEDANDLTWLRQDPALKMACERRPSQPALASQPTISRLENAARPGDLLRMGVSLGERVIAQLPAKTKRVVLDVDATDDPCHGQQQLECFNGFYDEHCYLPLHLYVTGPDGRQRLLASLLRPGNASYRAGLFGLLRRAVKLLRARFPRVKILLRADAGFGYADVLAFSEEAGIDYVLGLRTNKRLATLSTSVQMRAAIKYAWEGEGCREYGEFAYKAGPWPHARRVVVKAEMTRHELNPRYLVTSLKWKPEKVYRFYCQRGDPENRIKELKLDLASGRTSCHRFFANQFRLLLHTAACVLLQALQQAAEGTEWAQAQAGTLRVRLLKVAARVVESCRKLWLHLPTSCPVQEIWLHLNRRLAGDTT